MRIDLAPVVKDRYTDRERAVIAGYLLKQRAGTLSALHSVGSVKAGTTENWAEGNFRYYTDAERYSRFLLYWIGYEVPRGGMYGD